MHGGTLYIPRHTPSARAESELKAPDVQFTQRVALVTTSGVSNAMRIRHMANASQNSNVKGAYGETAHRKVTGNSLPGVYRAVTCRTYEGAETQRRRSHFRVDIADGGWSDATLCAGTHDSVDGRRLSQLQCASTRRVAGLTCTAPVAEKQCPMSGSERLSESRSRKVRSERLFEGRSRHLGASERLQRSVLVTWGMLISSYMPHLHHLSLKCGR